MILGESWDGLWTLFLLGSHNFMVMALGSCVKWALRSTCTFHPTPKCQSSSFCETIPRFLTLGYALFGWRAKSVCSTLGWGSGAPPRSSWREALDGHLRGLKNNAKKICMLRNVPKTLSKRNASPCIHPPRFKHYTNKGYNFEHTKWSGAIYISIHPSGLPWLRKHAKQFIHPHVVGTN